MLLEAPKIKSNTNVQPIKPLKFKRGLRAPPQLRSMVGRLDNVVCLAQQEHEHDMNLASCLDLNMGHATKDIGPTWEYNSGRSYQQNNRSFDFPAFRTADSALQPVHPLTTETVIFVKSGHS